MQQKIITILGSKKYFYGVVALLIFQAVWIALSGRFPMAFDEDFHLGVIRLYAEHISPFMSAQPANADMYGAVYRDPSYLYHYLMSFPYRALAWFVHGQTTQVLLLRFMNIALFASCLPIFRKLLLASGASRAVVHTLLTFFVLLPITPFLAAQINYDNLFIPLVGIVLLVAATIDGELARYKRLNTGKLLLLVILCLLTSLVKYAFLPIFIAVAAYLGFEFYRYLGSRRKFWRTFVFGLTLIGKRSRWLLAIGLVLSSLLFAQRYGVNLVRYHQPVPDCQQVLSIPRCSLYPPWVRDYILSTQKGQQVHGLVAFSGDWLYGMWLRTFFAVAGPDTDFETRGPLVLPGMSVIVLLVAGVLAFVWKAKAVLRRYDSRIIILFCVSFALYVGLLWYDEYKAYLHAGKPVAINGRYLLPILLPFMLLMSLGFTETFKKQKQLQLLLAGIGLLCFLWGGGVLTYILRSREAWYWPNHTVVNVNQTVRNTLYRAVPGSTRPTQFLR